MNLVLLNQTDFANTQTHLSTTIIGNTAAQEFVRNLTVSFPRNVLAMMGHFEANHTCVPHE